MQKGKLLFSFTIGLFLISFVSAYYGSYGSFSLSDLLDSIDSSTMILGAVFIISFALVNFALVRVFRDNKATAGIVAFVVSLLITYGINRTGFDFEGLFYNVGISEGFLYAVLPFVLLAGVIYLGIRFSFGTTLIGVGFLLIIISFTDFIYEKGIAIFIGVILILIGKYLPNFGGHLDYKRKLSEQKYGQKLDYKLRKQMLKSKYKLESKYEPPNNKG